MGTTLSGTNYTVSSHPLVIRYMKGVFNSRKPAPKYSETWDVNVVLHHLSLMYPLEKLSLKELTFKLVGLLALTSGQRCQVLVSMDIKSMKKADDYYLFDINKHMKQNRPGYTFSSIYVRKYQQQELCVYRTLESYLIRTLPLRQEGSTKLLVSYVKPYAPVGTSTVGRWIKNLLGLSGIDTTKFKAHSTRSASTSKASQTIPTDTILKYVGWSSDSTFRKFYNRPVAADDAFQNAVLQ